MAFKQRELDAMKFSELIDYELTHPDGGQCRGEARKRWRSNPELKIRLAMACDQVAKPPEPPHEIISIQMRAKMMLDIDWPFEVPHLRKSPEEVKHFVVDIAKMPDSEKPTWQQESLFSMIERAFDKWGRSVRAARG